jgi:hypothetical protein
VLARDPYHHTQRHIRSGKRCSIDAALQSRIRHDGASHHHDGETRHH